MEYIRNMYCINTSEDNCITLCVLTRTPARKLTPPFYNLPATHSNSNDANIIKENIHFFFIKEEKMCL